MIKIENTATYGWEAAIRGMRNPMNSWRNSDSLFDDRFVGEVSIGENDLALMRKLVKAGTDHSKFLRMISVYVDITAPLYWFKEFSTYKVGTVANSTSTMHKIHDKEFTLDDFSHEHLMDELDFERTFKTYLCIVIDGLNEARKQYIETGDKFYWWQMIQLLPSSYNQRRTVMLNYAVLRNMYHARKNHRLDEWKTMLDWIETLPYSELITA